MNFDNLKEVDRFNEPPISGTMCDVMWSDPLLEELAIEMKINSDADFRQFLELDYLPNIPRGCSSIYGYASILRFLKVNFRSLFQKSHTIGAL